MKNRLLRRDGTLICECEGTLAELLNTPGFDLKSLRGSDLRDCHLRGSNLSGSNLSDSNLSGSNLSYSDLRGSYLSGSNLSDCDLRGCNLSDCNLGDCNLSGSNLSGSNLSYSNLRGSDLRGSDLRDCHLRGSNLSGAKNILHAAKWMEQFEQTADGIIVFKRIGAGKTSQPPPEHWKIEPGAEITEVPNPIRTQECGCGVNFGTLDWCQKNYDRADLWRCLIRWIDLADVCVPYNTDGKARCARMTLIGVCDSDGKLIETANAMHVACAHVEG